MLKKIILTLVISGFVSVAHAGIQAGISYYKSENYSDAFRELLPLAQKIMLLRNFILV